MGWGGVGNPVKGGLKSDHSNEIFLGSSCHYIKQERALFTRISKDNLSFDQGKRLFFYTNLDRQ